ncbi:hypothetical protein KAR91_08595 [Candidatus Pacearchaeota archaeon]|nr:hypothetical protein [Candidatus Pacearchaeota archaeon]
MAGRGCKKVISDEDMARAEDMAYHGCQNGTIAGLMGWADAFIAEHEDIRKKLTLKRQQMKFDLRRRQLEQGKKTPVMNIFLGKNYLGQADKQEISGKDGVPLVAPVINIMPKEGK